MSYNKDKWKARIAERSDMSTGLVHLTREKNSDVDVFDVLYQILKSKKIKGSTTSSGFICGNNPAACFQDVPLSSICQNVYFEQKRIADNKQNKLRYRAIGLLFPKDYVFKKGGRPVIYDKTEEAKNYLPPEKWWKIVNMDFSDKDNIVDWSHEREWRVKGDFQFELDKATILVISYSSIKPIVERIKKEDGIDIREKIKGVVSLNNVLY